MDIDQKNPWIVSELDPLEEMEFTKVTNSKSKVWEHFTKNAHFQKAKCNDCGKILSITQGSTKSLIGHLRNKHKIVLESSTNKISENVKEEILDQINDDDNYYLEQTMEEYAENPYEFTKVTNSKSKVWEYFSKLMAFLKSKFKQLQNEPQTILWP